MTSAKVVETSVTVNNNSPLQDYVHPDDQTQSLEIFFSYRTAIQEGFDYFESSTTKIAFE